MARIVVVGAGIVGLSVARAARRRRHDVVVLEQGDIPNPDAASYDSHRLIRFHYGDAAGYTRMVADAFAAWTPVWDELGACHFVDVGAIAISEAPGDYAYKTLATFRALGIPHEVLDRDGVERLCPQYDVPEGAIGVVAGPAGPLFADRIVTGLAHLVAERGATLRPRSRVVAVDRNAAAATLEGGETVAGDFLVVAAGAWLPGLMPAAFGDVATTRQVLCYVAPPAAYEAAWRDGPVLVSYGDRGTYTLPGVMGTDLKFGYGGLRRAARPDLQGFAAANDEAAGVLAGFAPLLRRPEAYRPLRLKVGYYVRDDSRKFRFDGARRSLVVTNCDGQMFKFGPLVGERILAAIDGESDFTMLARWAAGE